MQNFHKLFEKIFSQINNLENPLNRKIRENLISSQLQAEGTLNLSVEVLVKLRQQNNH